MIDQWYKYWRIKQYRSDLSDPSDKGVKGAVFLRSRRHRRDASSSSGTQATTPKPLKPVDTSTGGSSYTDPSEKGVKKIPLYWNPFSKGVKFYED